MELYKLGGFKSWGREPKPKQHGNWISADDLGRTFEVGSRKNGKLARIYEKGKQLGQPWKEMGPGSHFTCAHPP